MIDIFYNGKKPNLFVFEKQAVSLEDAAMKSKTKFYWYIYGNNDYVNFNFEWRPAPWEEHQIHCFGTQWQRTGGAYLANKNTVLDQEWHFRTEQKVTRCVEKSKWIIPSNIIDIDFDYSWHPDELEPDYEYHFPTQWQREGGPIYKGTAGIKFVANQKVKTGSTQIFYMDFLNESSDGQFETLKKRYPDIKNTRYVNDHLTVFKRIINLAKTEFVWIVSSICDYTNFDFTWHPPAERREMIHVFPSIVREFGNLKQKRGDTFYIHVPSFQQQLYELELLDWFKVINYIDDQIVPRFPLPVVDYNNDSLVEVIKQHHFNHPYSLFRNYDQIINLEPPCLWHPKDRELISINCTNSISLVPRESKNYIQEQIYDYPYIIKLKSKSDIKQNIIFISYDEPQADDNWELLKTKFDTAQRLHGVQGMHNALLEAAKLSKTPWYYAVFAKTKVADSFNFDFDPDYFQAAKHYIFHAKNVLNDLEYGHMGIVLYNCNLVKNQKKFGIDYTMSAPHAVIPKLSAIAAFNSNPYHTWRTAFRECAKLSQFIDEQQNIENQYRLDTWLTTAKGEHANWCLRGARDGYEFYQANKTNPAELKQAFDWTWLQKYFESIYNNITCPDLNVLEQRQGSWQHIERY
jgi:hypothetical protein